MTQVMQDRAYQEAAVNAPFDYYASGKTGNPLICLPTGTGKSYVIAKFMKKVLTLWPRQRFIVASHVKEILEQDYRQIRNMWPEAPAGIHSSGLDQRDTVQPIIFGGIQSMVKNPLAFGWRDIVIVDEAHLMSGKEDSNYGKFLAALRTINPNIKVIGFTATKWRTGSGLLSDGPIFTDVCFDLTSMEEFNKLIVDGYLCTLIPKRTGTELDVSGVKIEKGDYVQGQLQKAVDKDNITYAVCQEIIIEGSDRNSWLVFASGIEHATHIAQTLQIFGMDALAVHSKMKDDERDKILRDFKSGKLRCVVNYGILTTGFDHPGLDLIAMLRPTTSSVLWVQMLGRGTRPHPGKQNCKVLDFAGNTKRLGPINDPVIPKKRGQKQDGTMPVRICEQCGTYNHARATVCINCGMEFPLLPKITTKAGTDELIATSEAMEPIVQEFKIDKVLYHRKQKGVVGLPMIKVSYFSGLQMFEEMVCIEHPGWAGRKAQSWWMQRLPGQMPVTVDEALKLVGSLKVPQAIRVWTNKPGKYPEIMAPIF